MDTKTHKYITSTAITTLYNRGEWEYLNAKELNEKKDNIVYYSAQPDFDENDGAFKGHFYNPATDMNFNGEYDSALSRFYIHYTNAVANKDMQKLGRAIHYLVDLCTPVHTYNQDVFDAVTNISSHVFFEDKCNDLVDTLTKEDIDQKINPIYFSDNSIQTIGKNAALNASVLFEKYAKIKTKSDIVPIAVQSILNALKCVMGVLDKYTLDQAPVEKHKKEGNKNEY